MSLFTRQAGAIAILALALVGSATAQVREFHSAFWAMTEWGVAVEGIRGVCLLCWECDHHNVQLPKSPCFP
jgi:hypothetical protein